MAKHIAIIQGHPDSSPQRFCRAFEEAYARAARAAGHTVEIIDVATLTFPFLSSKAAFESGEPPPEIRRVQEIIRKADHLVLIFPLWLGDMPALLKALLEQTLRPDFAFRGNMERGRFQKLLRGKSARIVITMGMPAIIYRAYFGAHGLKNLRRNILAFCGISPIRQTLIGMIERNSLPAHQKWLARAETLGRAGE